MSFLEYYKNNKPTLMRSLQEDKQRLNAANTKNAQPARQVYEQRANASSFKQEQQVLRDEAPESLVGKKKVSTVKKSTL